VDQPDFPWREDFKGLAAGSPEFDAAWSRVGRQEPERFKEAQRSYLQTHNFDPAARLLKSKCGLDVTVRSLTFQEVVWSFALEGRAQPIAEACQTLRDKGNWHLADPNFDAVLIFEIYEILFSRHEELNAAQLAILGQLRPTPFAQGGEVPEHQEQPEAAR
jgi:hypothetical protein